jgi:hypothetical protein
MEELRMVELRMENGLQNTKNGGPHRPPFSHVSLLTTQKYQAAIVVLALLVIWLKFTAVIVPVRKSSFFTAFSAVRQI